MRDDTHVFLEDPWTHWPNEKGKQKRRHVFIPIFLAGADVTTLPVQLFAYASYKSDPMVAAVSVLIIVFSLAIVAIAEKLFGIQKLLRG